MEVKSTCRLFKIFFDYIGPVGKRRIAAITERDILNVLTAFDRSGESILDSSNYSVECSIVNHAIGLLDGSTSDSLRNLFLSMRVGAI